MKTPAFALAPLLLVLVPSRASLAGAAQGKPADVARDLPGGIADAEGKVVYLGERGAGIVALDGADGTVLWTSTEAHKPLALIADHLVALKAGTGQFRIAFLELQHGKLIAETDPVTLPSLSDAATGMDRNEDGRSFASRASLIEGGLMVKWSARRSYTGGANPGPEILERTNRSAAGIVKVTIEPFKMELLPDDGKPMPSAFVGGKTVKQLPDAVQEIAQLQHWEFGCVIGERVFGLAHDEPVQRAGAGVVQADVVHAVDLKTGKELWKRTYDQRTIEPPRP